jgi:hypoxanthine phosphoribosyltransferase
LKIKSYISKKNCPIEYFSWEEVESLIKVVAGKVQRSSTKKYDSILAVTNRGIIPARLIARELNINDIQFICQGKLEGFKRQAAVCISYVKEKDPGTL